MDKLQKGGSLWSKEQTPVSENIIGGNTDFDTPEIVTSYVPENYIPTPETKPVEFSNYQTTLRKENIDYGVSNLLDGYRIKDVPNKDIYDFVLSQMEQYKSKKQLQEAFTGEDGKFDDVLFNKWYNTLKSDIKANNESAYMVGLLPYYTGDIPLEQKADTLRNVQDRTNGWQYAQKVNQKRDDVTNQQWALDNQRIYDKSGKLIKYSGNYTDLLGDWSDKAGISYAELVGRGFYVDKGSDGKPILKEADWGTDLSMKDRLGYFGVSRKDEADWLYDIPYYTLTGATNGVMSVLSAPAELAQMLSEVVGSGMRLGGMSEENAKYYSGYNALTGLTNTTDAFKLGKYEGNEGLNKAISETIGFGLGMVGTIVATGGLGGAGLVSRSTPIVNTLSKVMTPNTGKIVNSLLLNPNPAIRKSAFTLNMMALGSQQTMDAMRESGIDMKYRGMFAIPVGATFALLGQMDDFLVGGNTAEKVLNSVGLLNTTALLRKNMVEAVTPLKAVINNMTEREAEKFAMKLGETVVQKTVRSMMNSPMIGRTLFETGQEISEELAGKYLLQLYNQAPESWNIGKVKKEYTKVEGKDLFLAGIGGASMGAISNITSRAKESGKMDSLASLVTNDKYYNQMQTTLTEQADDKIRNKKWMYAPIDTDDKGNVISYGSFIQSANSVNATIAKENLSVLRNAWDLYKEEYKKATKTYEGADEEFIKLFKEAGDVDSMYSFLAKDKFADELSMIKEGQDNEQVITQIQGNLKQQLDNNATGIKREFFDKVMYVMNGGNPEMYKTYNTLNQKVIKNNFNKIQDYISTNPTTDEIDSTIKETITNKGDVLETLYGLLTKFDTAGKGYVNDDQQETYDELKNELLDDSRINVEVNRRLDLLSEALSNPENDTEEVMQNFAKSNGLPFDELFEDVPTGEVVQIEDEEGNPIEIEETALSIKNDAGAKIAKLLKEEYQAKVDALPERKNIEDKQKGQDYLAQLSQDVYFQDGFFGKDFSINSLITKAEQVIKDKDYSMADFANDKQQLEEYLKHKRNQIQYNLLTGGKVNTYLPDNEGDISPVLTPEQAKMFNQYLVRAEQALAKLQLLAIENESNFVKDNFTSSLGVFQSKLDNLQLLFPNDADFKALSDSLLIYQGLIDSIDPNNPATVEGAQNKESELFQLITTLEDSVYTSYQGGATNFDNIITDLTVKASKAKYDKEGERLLRQLFYLKGITQMKMSEVNGKIIDAVDKANTGDTSKRFFPSYEQIEVLQGLYLHSTLREEIPNINYNTIFVNGYNGTGKTKLMELFSYMVSGKIKYFGHSEQQNKNLKTIVGNRGTFLFDNETQIPTTGHSTFELRGADRLDYLNSGAKSTLEKALETIKGGDILIVDEHTLAVKEALDILVEASETKNFKLVFIGDLGQASNNYFASYTREGVPKYKANNTREMKLQQRGGIITIRKLTDYFRDIQSKIASIDMGEHFKEKDAEKRIQVMQDIIDNAPMFLYQQGSVNNEESGISVVSNIEEAKQLVADRDVMYVGVNDVEDYGVTFKSISTAQGSEKDVIVLDLGMSMAKLLSADTPFIRSNGGLKQIDELTTLFLYVKGLLSASGRAKTHLIIVDNGNTLFSQKLQKIEGKVSVFENKITVRKALYEQGLKTFERYRNSTSTTPTTEKSSDSNTGFDKFISQLNTKEADGYIMNYTNDSDNLTIYLNNDSNNTGIQFNLTQEQEIKDFLDALSEPISIEVLQFDNEGKINENNTPAELQNTQLGTIVYRLDNTNVETNSDTYYWKDDKLHTLIDNKLSEMTYDGKSITKEVFETEGKDDKAEFVKKCKIDNDKNDLIDISQEF